MPAKTNTENIVQLLQDVATLRENIGAFEREFARLEKNTEQRLLETDRKLWHLTIVLFGALLSLITAIIAGLLLFQIRQ